MDSVVKLLNDYSQYALIISILISIVIAILGLVPSVFVTGANLIFFGPFLGFIVSLVGETIGNYISFKLYKKGFKKSIEKRFSNYKILENISESDGNKAAFLIFQARVVPFIPSGIVTLAASLSNIDDFRYVLATCIGKIPSIGLEMLVSYGILTSGEKYIQIIIGIVAIYLIYKTFKKEKK